MSSHIPTFEPEQVWFTSDTHFGHKNIIRFCNRPFQNAEEMNAELIRRWRDTVPEDGIVFHLGDFAHGSFDGQCNNGSRAHRSNRTAGWHQKRAYLSL